MLRISRVVVIAALLALPTYVVAQDDSTNGPAPAEPTESAASEATTTPEKYNRNTSEDVPPIADTAPAKESATAQNEAAELRAEIKALREELAQLKDDLKALRADYDALDAAVADHAESLKTHTGELAQNAKLLKNVESEQQTLAGKLSDMAEAGETRTTAKFPPVAQDDAAAREELLRNTRYRLRIHNTTGVEQPLTIDGKEWLVRADEWSFVPVPNGPVTVRRAGREPLQIAGNPDQWQSDKRGFYIDYDLDGHQLEQPEAP